MKHSANHDSTQILALTVQEITRMASEISNNPVLPLAHCLTDLLDALLNLLTKLPEMRESLVDSLKLGIISCFQAYPRLSQASTESIARMLIKIVEKMADDKDVLVILDEACEYSVTKIGYFIIKTLTCLNYFLTFRLNTVSHAKL